MLSFTTETTHVDHDIPAEGAPPTGVPPVTHYTASDANAYISVDDPDEYWEWDPETMDDDGEPLVNTNGEE